MRLPYSTDLGNSLLFLGILECLGSDDASKCKIMEIRTNPLPVFSLTTLSLRSNDQKPAVPLT